jgi:hypothetical protein
MNNGRITDYSAVLIKVVISSFNKGICLEMIAQIFSSEILS